MFKVINSKKLGQEQQKTEKVVESSKNTGELGTGDTLEKPSSISRDAADFSEARLDTKWTSVLWSDESRLQTV